MKITFARDFSWNWPEYKGRVSTQYKAGQTYTVKRDCGDEAIAKGVAQEEAPSEIQRASTDSTRTEEYERALTKAQTATRAKIKAKEADAKSTD